MPVRRGLTLHCALYNQRSTPMGIHAPPLTRNRYMTIIRIFIFIGAVALTMAIIWAIGADDRGLGPVVSEMLREPWSIVTLLDLYLGFIIAALVMFLFERNKLVAVIWALPVFFLGNVWTALWVIYRLPEIARRLRG